MSEHGSSWIQEHRDAFQSQFRHPLAEDPRELGPWQYNWIWAPDSPPQVKAEAWLRSRAIPPFPAASQWILGLEPSSQIGFTTCLTCWVSSLLFSLN